MSPALAARMGAHAAAVHRETGTEPRNPFRHPAMRELARIWAQAYREARQRATSAPAP